MVKVEYLGRLGNQMFQYALGRHLAETMGYELLAESLPFPEAKRKVTGRRFAEPQQYLRGHYLDMDSILAERNQRKLILRGYFQQSCLYLSFMDKIRKWFKIDMPINAKLSLVSSSDILIYLRLGDYFRYGLSLAYQFYDRAIELASPKRVFIATDEPNHPFLEQFKKYSFIPLSNKSDPIADMIMANYFKKVAISCSTFSWWAAILSNPSEVYFPIGRSGYWAGCNSTPFERSSIDLRIDDPRYTYIYNCPVIKTVRPDSAIMSIDRARPDLLPAHKQSKAFQFGREK